MTFANSGDTRRAGSWLEPLESGDCFWSTDLVADQTHVLLELQQGGLGGGSEDPIDSSRVEPERPEAELELGHVVASKHRRGEVEQAVTKGEAGLNQRQPGVLVTGSGDIEPSRRLESTEGAFCGGAEGGELMSWIESRSSESGCEVANRRAVISSGERKRGAWDFSNLPHGRAFLKELGKLFEHLRLSPSTDDPVLNEPVFEDEDRGNAHDVEVACQGWVLVNVHLPDQ